MTKLAFASRIAAHVAVALSLAACAPVPLDQPKPESRAAAGTQDTPLGEEARAITRQTGKTVHVPLADGNQALGARLRLIEQAERTLDLQYFLMKPDLGAALISHELLAAADRGVRVRLLLDDVFTTTSDSSLLLLDAHPQIAVRIFNPAPRPGPKFAGFVTDFARANRRMHNKSFNADGAFAIVGGRNIADEYFQLDTSSEFADFDMLVTGPAVRGIGQAFDLFWNDGWAVPIHALHQPASAAELAEARADLNARLVPARSIYEAAVRDPYLERLSAGQVPFYAGATRVVSDRPGKLKVPVPQGRRDLGETLLREMRDARSDVLLVTPYFVPEDYGARLFSDLAARGVRVRVVTNSLASNNHAYVHAGYRRHRKALLKAGVELYEIRADALQVLGLVPEGERQDITMHTKLAIIDRRDVFVGSLNLDPRSIKQNTEFGVFVDSPDLARDGLDGLDDELADYTWQLRLSADDDLEWHYLGRHTPQVAPREPGATAWEQFVVGVTALLGVELQL